MQKLSKAEFMHKVINDKYEKRMKEIEKAKGGEFHIINNSIKTREFKRRKRR